MYTVRNKFESMLQDMGMFDSQSKKVMDVAIPEINKMVEGYSLMFNDDSGAYPDVIYQTVFPTIKEIALLWIEDNAPNAWFKDVFNGRRHHPAIDELVK